MKKIIIVIIFCLFIAQNSYALNNMEGMRLLTINELVLYGQKLYDRGDFNEASAVFVHVLTFDRQQAQALEYLKEMGRLPPVISLPVPQTQLLYVTVGVRNKMKPDQIKIELPNIVLQDSKNDVDLGSTESIKRAIEAQKIKIRKLHDQIREMKANIVLASTHVN